jgi:C4-dicarboxylate transporter DctM subunit
MYWAEEMIRYLYIFVAFLGISMGVKTNAHFSVQVVLNVLPKIIRKIVQTMSILIEIAFLSLLVYQSFLLIRRLYVMKQTSPMLHIPMFIPYTAIAVGSFTMCFRVITKLIHDLRYPDKLTGEGE